MTTASTMNQALMFGIHFYRVLFEHLSTTTYKNKRYDFYRNNNAGHDYTL